MWADGWPFSVLFPRNTYSGLSKSDNDTQLLQSIFPQNLHLVRKKMFFRLRQLTILSYKHELWDLALVAKTPQLLCGVWLSSLIFTSTSSWRVWIQQITPYLDRIPYKMIQLSNSAILHILTTQISIRPQRVFTPLWAKGLNYFPSNAVFM